MIKTQAGRDSPKDADSKTFYFLIMDQKLNTPRMFENPESKVVLEQKVSCFCLHSYDLKNNSVTKIKVV